MAPTDTNLLLEITAEKLVHGGDALARHEGRVVLVPFLLPGERARVEVVTSKPDLAHARVVELLTASPSRIVPACPHFGVCGGCHYQHAPYPEQLAAKEQILREVFTRIGKFPAPEAIETIHGPEWGYRNRIQLHLESGRVGYHAAGSHELCAVERCPVASPRLEESIAALRRLALDPRFPQFVRSLELFTNETAVQGNVLDTERRPARHFFDWLGEELPGWHDGALEYEAAGFQFRVSHQSFFQTNRYLVEALVGAAVSGAEGERALDLYAGVGLFSLELAKHFQAVTAVESGATAARDLAFNAARAGLAVEVVTGTAEEYLARLDTPPDFLLADPPRAGLGKHVVRRLVALAPRRLTVVSCNPATLARDLAALIGGGYRLDSVTLIDLFPHTAHIESVARLTAPEA